jgi:MFS transporter, DHA1 family, multidrug resistance protein
MSAQAEVSLPRWFVPAMSGFMGTAAMAIDSLLPAFPKIRTEFGLPPDSARPALLLTSFFLGLAAGQLFYGPLSDRFGRKRPLAVGLVVYIVGGLGAVLAPSLGVMIAFRFLWGMGAAGPRSLTLAMVRDTSEGDRMAKEMSTIMAIFIIIPVVAPAMGAGVMALGSWRYTLWLPIALAFVLLVVLWKLPETLPEHRRRAVSPRSLLDAARTVVSTRSTLGFGLAAVFLYGVMSGYIGTVEVIFEDVYDQSKAFPYLFGAIAVFLGVASFVNSRLVGRYGLNGLLRRLSVTLLIVSASHVVVAVAFDGRPPLAVYVLSLIVFLPVVTSTNPNCNTAAMTPMGAIAGTASAVLGTTMMAVGSILGALSNGLFDGSVTPFAVSSFVFVCVAVFCILVIGRPGQIRPT